MKKIIYISLVMFALTGCTGINNTPTKQVEGFFNKYQTLNKAVLTNLDSAVSSRNQFDEADKEKYKEIIKNQYKNLTYKIKEEKINGNVATVTAEITVKDFYKVLFDAENYKDNNLNKFVDEKGNYQDSLYKKYIINKLESTKEKVKYTLDFKLTKDGKKWKMNNIDTETEDKILGIYKY